MIQSREQVVFDVISHESWDTDEQGMEIAKRVVEALDEARDAEMREVPVMMIDGDIL